MLNASPMAVVSIVRGDITQVCVEINGFQNLSGTNHLEKDSNPMLVNTTLLQKSFTMTTTDSTSQTQPTKVCFLKTAIAILRTGNYQTQANILLDEKDQRSFISKVCL